jgi:hypothetical protein
MGRDLRMRESGDGRNTVFPWGDAPAPLQGQPAFAVGDTVYSGNSPEPGTVVSVDEAEATMGVKWRDVGGAIIYPLDAEYLRKAYPWE